MLAVRTIVYSIASQTRQRAARSSSESTDASLRMVGRRPPLLALVCPRRRAAAWSRRRRGGAWLPPTGASRPANECEQEGQPRAPRGSPTSLTLHRAWPSSRGRDLALKRPRAFTGRLPGYPSPSQQQHPAPREEQCGPAVLVIATLCAAMAFSPLAKAIAPTAGAARACSGSIRGGFFNHITAVEVSCSEARAVVRLWIRASGFPDTDEGITGFGDWTCRLAIHQGSENPYGVISCHASGGRRVRFLGTS
jgi:hypothetical protein